MNLGQPTPTNTVATVHNPLLQAITQEEQDIVDAAQADGNQIPTIAQWFDDGQNYATGRSYRDDATRLLAYYRELEDVHITERVNEESISSEINISAYTNTVFCQLAACSLLRSTIGFEATIPGKGSLGHYFIHVNAEPGQNNCDKERVDNFTMKFLRYWVLFCARPTTRFPLHKFLTKNVKNYEAKCRTVASDSRCGKQIWSNDFIDQAGPLKHKAHLFQGHNLAIFVLLDRIIKGAAETVFKTHGNEHCVTVPEAAGLLVNNTGNRWWT